MELFKQPVYLVVIYLRILLTATYYSSSSACEHSSGDLIIEPTFPFAKEGEIFNLTCTAKKTEGFIAWNIDPDKNNTYVSTAYDKARRELLSILTVHVVSTAQYFSCDLRSTADHHVCSSSRMVHLRVQYFPKKKDISCSPRDPEPFHRGDVLPIFCQVLRSNPDVDMRWKLFPDTTILSLSPYRDRRVHRVLSHELSVTNDLHMKKLLCEVTSKTVFPDRSLQCFIGPIKVYQAPKVNVQPTNAEIITNRPVKFSCVANGYPDEFTFTWSCLPHGVLEGCDSLSETAEISYLVDSGEAFEAEIICAVSNSMGHELGFSRVKVLPFNVNPSVSFTEQTVLPLTCQPNNDNITLKVTVTSDEEALNDTGVTVSCSLENILQERVEIQWYLGGNKLTEDASYEVDQVTSFKSEITFLNVNGKDYEEKLYCLVVLCNVTFTSSSVNLKRNLPSRQAHYHDYVPTHSWHTSVENQPVHTTHATSQITSTYQPSPRSGQVSRREVIAIAFYGALASVIVISSVVILLSFIMYRRFKMANMNHTCTNMTKEQDVHVYMKQEDFTKDELSDPDPIYCIPDTMNIKRDSEEFCNTTDSGYATQVYPIFSDRTNDSSDDCSSYLSSSLGCSSSRSSDISLERGVSNASINIQNVETKASTYVVYEK